VPPTTEVVFFDGFDDLDAIAPLEVLTESGFDVRAVCVPGQAREVRSAHGLQITVAGELSAAPELVVIPGGGWIDNTAVGARAQSEGPLPALLAGLHARGTVIASVCTGAMLLATAGLLRGRPAVTNRGALDDLVRFGAAVHAEARVVDDGSIVTSGGVVAGIDLALWLVERFCSADDAAAAAARLEHERVGLVLVAGSGPA
jgi:transcriptional regulator GlxA family with amidase domain